MGRGNRAISIIWSTAKTAANVVRGRCGRRYRRVSDTAQISGLARRCGQGARRPCPTSTDLETGARCNFHRRCRATSPSLAPSPLKAELGQILYAKRLDILRRCEASALGNVYSALPSQCLNAANSANKSIPRMDGDREEL